MDGESDGLNLHTREVNKGLGDGLLASSMVMLKETKVISWNFCALPYIMC